MLYTLMPVFCAGQAHHRGVNISHEFSVIAEAKGIGADKRRINQGCRRRESIAEKDG